MQFLRMSLSFIPAVILPQCSKMNQLSISSHSEAMFQKLTKNQNCLHFHSKIRENHFLHSNSTTTTLTQLVHQGEIYNQMLKFSR
jgi:hypothetical protein